MGATWCPSLRRTCDRFTSVGEGMDDTRSAIRCERIRGDTRIERIDVLTIKKFKTSDAPRHPPSELSARTTAHRGSSPTTARPHRRIHAPHACPTRAPGRARPRHLAGVDQSDQSPTSSVPERRPKAHTTTGAPRSRPAACSAPRLRVYRPHAPPERAKQGSKPWIGLQCPTRAPGALTAFVRTRRRRPCSARLRAGFVWGR